MITGSVLAELGFDFSSTTYDVIAIDDNFAAPDYCTDIYDYVGLSAEKIVEKCKYILERT